MEMGEMMTDRELLELAAKAAGISGKYNGVTNCFYLADDQPDPAGADRAWWNPRTDDGDALRLAVKLRMRVEVNAASVVAFWITDDGEQSVYEYPDGDQDDDFNVVFSGHEDATRRAIVRAAAEIGKAMS